MTVTCAKCGCVEAAERPRCPKCRRWGTFAEDDAPEAALPTSLAKVAAAEADRVRTKLYGGAFDELLGGGLVRGGVYFLAGDPGAGKSSLTLQLASAIPGPVRLVLAEERPGAIKARALRLELGRRFGHVYALEVDDVDLALDDEGEYLVTILDSVDCLSDPETNGQPGTTLQKLAVLQKVARYAKATGEVIIAISHVNKDGDFAGSMGLTHLVEAVLFLSANQDDPDDMVRPLTVRKNRGGKAPARMNLVMTETGLLPAEVCDGEA